MALAGASVVAGTLAIPIMDSDGKYYALHKDNVMTRAYNLGTQVLIFAEELRRLCKIHGYNFPGLFAQAWHETAGFTSALWNRARNPAGLKNTSAKAYQRYYNGVDAARGFIVHMSAYVPGRTKPALNDYRFLDSRVAVAEKANKGRTFYTMDDLAGFWAEDPMYGREILKTYKGLFGEI